MILTINVSNSNVTLAGFSQNALTFSAQIHTELAKSADEYAVQISSVLQLYGHSTASVEGVILSCVVPALLSCLQKAVRHFFTKRIYVVGPGLKTGLSIQTDNPAQMGSEIVCCAVAALQNNAAPCLLIAMDTAISIALLDANGALRGGVLAPGVKIGADALCARTAQLSQVDLCAPIAGVIGTNTDACVRAGIVLGTACMLDGMIDLFCTAANTMLTVLATGEIAPVILSHCSHTIAYHENLIHTGLFALYQKNAK